MSPSQQPPEHAAKSAAFRAGLRREKLAARSALDAATLTTLSARVEAHLDALLAELPYGHIAFCAAIRNEFDAAPLVGRLIRRGWRASMPVAVVPADAMVFRPWAPDMPMAVDPYGIPIPADTADAGIPDVLLLPLVAFDAAGFRLGYGGGYFDRTLAALHPRPLAVGVGFDLAQVPSIDPDAHDQRLDAAVTESGVRRFR
jgi:5,10-methenyltetrahydrofolate synthetase